MADTIVTPQFMSSFVTQLHYIQGVLRKTLLTWTTSSSLFVLRDSRARKTLARVKITLRERRRHSAGREKHEGPSFFSLSAACRLFLRGVIFMRARVSLALLFLSKNWGSTRSPLLTICFIHSPFSLPVHFLSCCKNLKNGSLMYSWIW